MLPDKVAPTSRNQIHLNNITLLTWVTMASKMVTMVKLGGFVEMLVDKSLEMLRNA